MENMENKIQCPVRWAEMPKWANFITVDADGEISVWEVEPKCHKNKVWVNNKPNSEVIDFGKYLGISLDMTNCQHHIWQRPQ